MYFSGGLFGRDELHAQLLGALGQLPQNTFAVALLVVVLALIGILLALRERRVDQPGAIRGGAVGHLRFEGAIPRSPENIVQTLRQS